MSYIPRTKDDPGDVGRAADQQQSIDNESALYSALLGPFPPATSGGVIRQFVKKAVIVDNTATEFATIVTTNETGSADGGVYGVSVKGIAVHSGASNTDNAVVQWEGRFARAMTAAGVGQNSAVVEVGETAPAESEGGTTKGILTVTMTVVETSEYEMSLRITIDLDGNAVTNATFVAMVELFYAGFLTAPVITSAG